MTRVFLGIKLTDDIANACARLRDEISIQGVLPVPREDLHITIVAPWEASDLPATAAALRASLLHTREFPIEFTRVSYGPTPVQPRLIWITCKQSRQLITLRKIALKTLSLPNREQFKPHATIARLSQEKVAHARYPIEKKISWLMPVTAVTLFRSPRSPSGYDALSTIRLL